MSSLENRTCRQLILTIGLFCSVELFLNFLDRSNISYAALQMNSELGFDSKIYGFAVGIFFLGYILFCLPAAAIAKRVGVRRTLATIIIVWAAIAGSMSFIQTATSFHALRFLLGIAEAGAAPTVTLLMTNWIPRRSFGRAMMVVAMAQPVGQLVGAPLSGYLMTVTNGIAGQSGWRWMFAVEGLMTLSFGIFTWVWVRDTPAAASWLSDERKNWLTAELASDAVQSNIEAGNRRRDTLGEVLSDLRIWLFGLILFCLVTGVLLFTFWLPQVLQQRQMSASTLAITMLSAVPWAGMMAGMLLFGLSSDHFRERPLHLAASMLIAAAGIGYGSAHVASPLGILGLSLGAFGLGGAVTVFWTMPPAYMSGTSGAAPAFAMINIIGNIAGIITPNLIGWMRARSGNFESTLYLVILVLVLGIVPILPVSRGRLQAKMSR